MACATCGADDNGLDLDHFFIPKSKGGNFVLKRKDGVLINNAVPMCETCNRTKGNKDWRSITEENTLIQILERNSAANLLVNEVFHSHDE